MLKSPQNAVILLLTFALVYLLATQSRYQTPTDNNNKFVSLPEPLAQQPSSSESVVPPQAETVPQRSLPPPPPPPPPFPTSEDPNFDLVPPGFLCLKPGASTTDPVANVGFPNRQCKLPSTQASLVALIEKPDEENAFAVDTDLNDRFPEFHIPFNVSDCKKIYLDCGSNKGRQLQKLYDGLLPGSPWAQQFDKYFGRGDRKDVCAFGWEPDPLHVEAHVALRKSWTERGLRAVSFPNPLHSTNDVLTFHTVRDDAHANWGSTLLKETAVSESETHEVKSFQVRTFNLVSFMKHKLPSDATVLMKIDIEGAEHSLHPILFLSKLLCKVTFIGMELHTPNKVPQSILTRAGGTPLPRQGEILRWAGGPQCRVQMSDFDDET